MNKINENIEEETSNGLSDQGNELINELRAEGFSMREIKDAMNDGLYLSIANIDQDTAEEVNNWIQYR